MISVIQVQASSEYSSSVLDAQKKSEYYFPNNMYTSPEEAAAYLPKHVQNLADSINYFEDYFKVNMKYNMDSLMPGYKKSLSAAYNYKGRIHTVNYVKYAKDFPKPTDRKLDFYISGKLNFFTVKSKHGQILYTQDGRFQVEKNGLLTTIAGKHQVLGKNGPIFLETSDITVKSDGNIYIEGDLIDSFKITAFRNDRGIWSDNMTHFYKLYPNLVEEVEPVVQITQGFIEGSNIFPGVRTASEYIDFHQGVTKASRVFFQSYSPMFRAVSTDN